MQELNSRTIPSPKTSYEPRGRVVHQSPESIDSKTLSSPKASYERARVSPQPPDEFDTRTIRSSRSSYEHPRRPSQPPEIFDSGFIHSPRTSYEQQWRPSQPPGRFDSASLRSPRGSYEQQGRVSTLPPDILPIDRSSASSPKPIPDSERDRLRRVLWELHNLTGIPPTVKILDGEVEKIGNLAVTGGEQFVINCASISPTDSSLLRNLFRHLGGDMDGKRKGENYLKCLIH